MKSVLLREWTNTSAEQYVISIASDPSASLIARQAATEILGNLDDPAALQFLETLVSSDVSEVSRAAVYAIKRINDRRYVSGVAPK
jgi:HEAT repeat protein